MFEETEEHTANSVSRGVMGQAKQPGCNPPTLFEGNTIIPAVERGEQNDRQDTRQVFFGLSESRINQEQQVLAVCNRNDFYTLLKNEPLLYISLAEFDLDCKGLAAKFGFEVSRDGNNGNLIIHLNPDANNPQTLNFSERLPDSEMAEEVRTFLTAKSRVDQMGLAKSLTKMNKLPQVRVEVDRKGRLQAESQRHQKHGGLQESLDLLHHKMSFIIAQNEMIMKMLGGRNAVPP